MTPAVAMLAAARSVLEQSCTATVPSVLVDWPVPGPLRSQRPSSLNVLRWLPQAVERALPGPTATLARMVAEAAIGLAWRQTYSTNAVSRAFLERYGWSEFCGLSGPVPSTALACGVLLLGPDTHYPPHRHAASEWYVPLSGTAEWQCDGGEFVMRPPGCCVVHRPGEPHAMRTVSEPLLALYLWSGDGLDTPAELSA